MDTTDYDRIEQIIQRSLTPVIASIQTKMDKGESLSRHSAMSDRAFAIERAVADAKASQAEIMKWAMGEHEKIRDSIETKLTAVDGNIDTRFNEVNGKIDSINNNISQNRATTLRYIISVIVSFFIGGGIIGIIEFFIQVSGR